jgi:GNAT superfamily N-acetyltransferase
VISCVQLDLEEAIRIFPRTGREREILSHPFDFKRTHFVIRDESGVQGRISANLSKSDPSRGYFGFLRVEAGSVTGTNGFAEALLAHAEAWLKENGAREAIGPVNYSTLFDYRVRLDSDAGSPSFFWEPGANPGCLPLLEASGYQLLASYHSRAYRDTASVLPFSEQRYREALNAGFKTRPIRFSGSGANDLEALYRINSSSFQDAFLAEPLDRGAYLKLNVPGYASLLSDFSFFLLNPEGVEVGYFFLFPDQGHVVWKTIAILPEYQKAGLAGFGIHHAVALAQEKGISRVVAALIREGAPSEALLSKAAHLMIWEHRYGVFKKALSSGCA